MGNGESTARSRLKIRSRTELRKVERWTESREAEEKIRQNVKNKIISSKPVNQEINDEFTTILSATPRKPFQSKQTYTNVGDTYWTESSSSSSLTENSSFESNYPSTETDIPSHSRRKRSSGPSKSCAQCQRTNWQNGYTPNEHGKMVHDTVHDADDREAMADALEWMQFEKPISYNNILKSQRVANGWMAKRIAERHRYTQPIPDRPFYLLEKFPELEEYPRTRDDHLKNYNAFCRRLRAGGPPQTETHYWKSFKNSVVSSCRRIRTPKSKQKSPKPVIKNIRAKRLRFPQF